MKRLYIVLTIVLSSFLMLYGREVKAATYTYNVDLSYINDDFYSFKEKVDSFIASDNNYSDYYIITYLNGSGYAVYFIDVGFEPSSSYGRVNSNGTIYLTFRSSFTRFFISSSGFSSPYSYSSSTGFDVYSSFEIYLYSNFSIALRPIFHNELILTYNDRSWLLSADNNDIILSLYDIYIDYYGIEEPEPEEPEPVDNTPILTNFYTTVIEKIGYLCGVIVSNYIYLSIFVIILIIILFELIFRRYL